jgi:hypothetical protein
MKTFNEFLEEKMSDWDKMRQPKKGDFVPTEKTERDTAAVLKKADDLLKIGFKKKGPQDYETSWSVFYSRPVPAYHTYPNYNEWNFQISGKTVDGKRFITMVYDSEGKRVGSGKNSPANPSFRFSDYVNQNENSHVTMCKEIDAYIDKVIKNYKEYSKEE